jgi:hypothetical protein
MKEEKVQRRMMPASKNPKHKHASIRACRELYTHTSIEVCTGYLKTFGLSKEERR